MRVLRKGEAFPQVRRRSRSERWRELVGLDNLRARQGLRNSRRQFSSP